MDRLIYLFIVSTSFMNVKKTHPKLLAYKIEAENGLSIKYTLINEHFLTIN